MFLHLVQEHTYIAQSNAPYSHTWILTNVLNETISNEMFLDKYLVQEHAYKYYTTGKYSHTSMLTNLQSIVVVSDIAVIII